MDTLVGFDLNASFDGNGNFVAGNVERRFSVKPEDGSVYERRARAVVSDLGAAVPSGALMTQVQTLTEQLAAKTTEAASLTTQLAAATEQITALQAALTAATTTPELTGPVAYSAAAQRLIDTTAGARGYADGVACASYTASTVLAWQAEALAFVAWRDSVWLSALDKLGKVQRGEMSAPTVEAFVASLPPITWPS